MANGKTQMGDKPVWFITGCSTGFGRELAQHLLDAGYRTVVTARNPDSLKDLGARENALLLKLRDAGTIQDFQKLNAAALAKYPGAKIEDTELEQEHGRYVYQVELRDAQGVQWDVELDATNGQILQEHRDD